MEFLPLGLKRYRTVQPAEQAGTHIQWPFGRADYAHSHYASIMADVQITH